MNAIIGMTAIAAAHLSDLKKVEECLMKIASSSRYLLGLINDILDLSRIERGKMSIRQEVFDFQEMIKKSRGDQFRTGSGAAAGFWDSRFGRLRSDICRR